MQNAITAFEQWQFWLEDEPDYYAARLLLPTVGLIWRNRAAREYYAAHGFPAERIIPWGRVKKWLPAADLRALQLITAAAFETSEAVMHTHTAQAAGYPPCTSETRFLAVYGDVEHGVVVTRMRPLTAPRSELVHLPCPIASEAPRSLSA